MASAGLIALIVEVNVRGWWGLATSGVELIVLMVWLSLSGVVSGWALHRSEDWWQAVALLGVLVSVVGVALLLILAVLWLVSEHPDILADDSKKKRRRSRGRGRRRRRRSW